MFGIPINNRDTALEWLKSQGKIGYVRIYRVGSKEPTDRSGEDGQDGAVILEDVKIRLERLPYGNYQLRCAPAKNSTASETVYEFVNVSPNNPMGMYGGYPGMYPGGYPPQMNGTGSGPAITEADVDRRIKEALEKKEKNDRIKELEKALKEKNKELKQKETALKQSATIGKVSKLFGLGLMSSDNDAAKKAGIALATLGNDPAESAEPAEKRKVSRSRDRDTDEDDSDDDDDDDEANDDEPETDMDVRFDEAVASLTEKGMSDEQIVAATETIGSLADKIGVDRTTALMSKIAAFTPEQMNAYLPMLGV